MTHKLIIQRKDEPPQIEHFEVYGDAESAADIIWEPGVRLHLINGSNRNVRDIGEKIRWDRERQAQLHREGAEAAYARYVDSLSEEQVLAKHNEYLQGLQRWRMADHGWRGDFPRMDERLRDRALKILKHQEDAKRWTEAMEALVSDAPPQPVERENCYAESAPPRESVNEDLALRAFFVGLPFCAAILWYFFG